jgi:hypothetical protein
MGLVPPVHCGSAQSTSPSQLSSMPLKQFSTVVAQASVPPLLEPPELLLPELLAELALPELLPELLLPEALPPSGPASPPELLPPSSPASFPELLPASPPELLPVPDELLLDDELLLVLSNAESLPDPEAPPLVVPSSPPSPGGCGKSCKPTSAVHAAADVRTRTVRGSRRIPI